MGMRMPVVAAEQAPSAVAAHRTVGLVNWSLLSGETSVRHLQRLEGEGASLTRASIFFHFDHMIPREGVHQPACPLPHSLREPDAGRVEEYIYAVPSVRSGSDFILEVCALDSSPHPVTVVSTSVRLPQC